MRWLILVFGLILAALVLPPLWYAATAAPPPELPAPGRRVEVWPGLSVNVIEQGTGPAVLLVHGHPGCAYDWQPLMAELAARGFRAIAYDRLGYGYSDGRPSGNVTVEQNAEELYAIHEPMRGESPST
jgi:pimeloyl-ACP methyl ester carboxylesterase